MSFRRQGIIGTNDDIFHWRHYSDVIISAMASQITVVSMVRATVCSGADQRKHQSSASLAFVRGIHRWPVNSPHKGPVTRKMFPFHDVIMRIYASLGFNELLMLQMVRPSTTRAVSRRRLTTPSYPTRRLYQSTTSLTAWIYAITVTGTTQDYKKPT